jgi:anti-sigma factor RsiW
MRCSSCEPLLDQYLERVLSPRAMLRVAKHLHSCKACHALLNELRSVDGLLLGAKQPELPPNFTFALMAEVRSQPSTRRRRIPAWAMLAAYLICAWFAAAAAIAIYRGRWPNLATGFASLQNLSAWRATASVVHAFAPATPVVAITVAVVLALDVALLVAVFAFYRSVRPRLAAAVAVAPVDFHE